MDNIRVFLFDTGLTNWIVYIYEKDSKQLWLYQHYSNVWFHANGELDKDLESSEVFGISYNYIKNLWETRLKTDSTYTKSLEGESSEKISQES